MFYAGQTPTAGQMNTELGVSTFRAGQKLRTSQLDPSLTPGEWLRAWEMNLVFANPTPGPGPDPDPGPDPGTGGTPANPGEALWIGSAGGKNHFNVGIGQPGGGTNHNDYTQSQIESGFTQDDRFRLTSAGDTQFKMFVGYGRTSSGTQYARSELRELQPDGTTKAAWNGSSGTHYMKGRSRITHVAAVKPWVCFFQIHDASSDLVRVQTESGGSGPTGLRIVARRSPPSGGSEVVTTIRNAYTLGTWIDWDIRIVSGTLSITLDGSQVLSASGFGTSGCYFKTGCYNQSNTTTENGDSSQYFSVEIAKGSLQCWHTGYTAPSTPVFTG